MDETQVQVLAAFLGGLYGFLFAVALWLLTQGADTKRRRDTLLRNLAHEVATNGAFLIRAKNLVDGLEGEASKVQAPPILSTYVRSSLDNRAFHDAIASPDYDGRKHPAMDGNLRQFYSVIPFGISTEETIMHELFDRDGRGEEAFLLLRAMANASQPAIAWGNAVLKALADMGYQVEVPPPPPQPDQPENPKSPR